MKNHLRTLRAGRLGRSLPALMTVGILALATALPAAGQASRTRPGSSSGGTASGSGSGGSASSGSSSRGSGGTIASDTRSSSSGSEKVKVERDRRSRGGGRDVVIVNPWGWSYPYRWNWGWSPWYWGWYGWDYGPYGGGYYPPVAWHPRRAGPDMGALDLDLKPGNTQIWIDGQYIGIADRFDGWPGYLWLEEGDYEFVFHAEGRRTIHRQYRVHPGLVIDVEDRLEPGEATPPEELFQPRPTPRRDARIERNEEQRRRVAERAEREDGRDEGWREMEEATGGILRLSVTPPDASVYLDGRFLGTGAEVGGLRRGLAVDAGEHVLEVVRPGHEPEVRRFTVEADEELELEVVLETH